MARNDETENNNENDDDTGMVSNAAATTNNNNNAIPFQQQIQKLLGPILLVVLAVQSIISLTVQELPAIITGQPNADYFGAIFDTLFLGWACQNLVLQTGILAENTDFEEEETTNDTTIALAGLECRINVDIGREPGTWMDKDWGVSGKGIYLLNHV